MSERHLIVGEKQFIRWVFGALCVGIILGASAVGVGFVTGFMAGRWP